MEFTNYPQPRERSEYDQAVTQYLERLRQRDPEAVVCQIGNVGVPGISDIDLVIGAGPEGKTDYSVYHNLDPHHHYLFLHDVYVVPRQLLPWFRVITSIFDFEVRSGPAVQLEPESEEGQAMRKLIMLNDVSLVSLSYEYERWAQNQVNDARLVMARLNALKYPIQLLRELAESRHFPLPTSPEYQDYVADFKAFRESFFDRTPEANLEPLKTFLARARQLAQNLLDDIARLNLHLSFLDNKLESARFNYFQETLTGEGALTFMFCNLYAYRLMTGLISKSINKNFSCSGTVNFNHDFHQLLNTRMELLNNIIAFQEKKGITFGQLWPFGYSRPLGHSEKFFNLLARGSNKSKALIRRIMKPTNRTGNEPG